MLALVRRTLASILRKLAWLSRRLTWAWLERLCMGVFLLSKVYWLHARWGMSYGYDWDAQLEVTGLLHWGHLNLGLKECFNCHQPPLGFLIPKIPMALGMRD